MTCPSCGGELDPALDRCPVCDSSGMPRVEGALAADPRFVTPPARAKAEPLRDIPGLRKREKTWRDEVQERVRSRRNKRALAGLPLFEQAEEQETQTSPQPTPPQAAGRAWRRAAGFEPGARGRQRDGARRARGRGAARRARRSARPLRGPGHDAAERRRARRPAAERGRGRDREPRARGGRAAARHAAADAVARRGGARRRTSMASPRSSCRRSRPRPRRSSGRLSPSSAPRRPPSTRSCSARSRWSCSTSRAGAARVDVTALAPSWPGIALYLGLLALFYAGYFTGTTGQTPGKLMTGLRVLGASGRPPSYTRAMLRALLGLRRHRARGRVPRADGVRPRPPHAPRPPVPHARRPPLSAVAR